MIPSELKDVVMVSLLGDNQKKTNGMACKIVRLSRDATNIFKNDRNFGAVGVDGVRRANTNGDDRHEVEESPNADGTIC